MTVKSIFTNLFLLLIISLNLLSCDGDICGPILPTTLKDGECIQDYIDLDSLIIITQGVDWNEFNKYSNLNFVLTEKNKSWSQILHVKGREVIKYDYGNCGKYSVKNNVSLPYGPGIFIIRKGECTRIEYSSSGKYYFLK